MNSNYSVSGESELIPYVASQGLMSASVLVLAPHADDEVFGCGGAILRHVQTGAKVRVVVMTDGSVGGEPSVRRTESRGAALELGYGEPIFWDYPDRGLLYSETIVQRVLTLVKENDVDLLYAPSSWEVHPDHRQTFAIAREVALRCSPQLRLVLYEVGVPLQPNLLLDISDVAEAKGRAMRCFGSQLLNQDYADQIEALNLYRTYTLPNSVKAAEAYRLVESEALCDGWGEGLRPSWQMFTEKMGLPTEWPLVSILIRSMDLDVLSRALDSVALQDYGALEVVVVAAKTDHRPLPARCGRFPLRLLQTTEALMRSRAANVALQNARGEMLLFLDDDDWLMPGHISRLVRTLQAFPGVPAAYTGVGLVDATGASIGQAFDIPFDPVRLLAGNLTPIHGALFRKSVLDAGCRMDEALDRFEDWDFWLQVSRLGPMVHLPGVSAVYKLHQSSGVHEEAGPLGEPAQDIYEKWRSRWTKQEVGALMQRVWSHSDLENTVHSLQARNNETAQRVQFLSSALQAQTDQVENQSRLLLAHKTEIELQKGEIERSLAALEQANEHGQQLGNLLAAKTSELQAIRNSRSWRWTSGLRFVTEHLRTTPLRSMMRMIRRTHEVVRKDGWSGLLSKFNQRRQTHRSQLEYAEWVKLHDTLNEHQLRKLISETRRLASKPLLSIVMPVYNPPIDLLEKAISSISAQVYSNWELCIADDASTNPEVWTRLQAFAAAEPRIRVMRRETNGHIANATNSALGLVKGEFIVLMDNDDVLSPDALYWVANAIAKKPTVQIIYSDEDKLDSEEKRFGPYFKPDWNYTLFLGHNLISHLGVYRTELVRRIGGFRSEMNGSQDYDLALRCIEVIDHKDIVHIPRVLYHWRAIEGSTATGNDAKPYALIAAERALNQHLSRQGKGGSVEALPSWNFRYSPPSLGPDDSVSVVIIQTGKSTDKREAIDWVSDAVHGVGEVLYCSSAVDELKSTLLRAQGSLIALIRDDLRPKSADSLKILVGYSRTDGCGIAAGTCVDQEELIVSGGLILSRSNGAQTLFKGCPSKSPGYMGRGLLAQELSGVSMDCVVFRRELREQIGNSIDSKLGTSELGAVAASMRLRDAGLKLIWCPHSHWQISTADSHWRLPMPSDTEFFRSSLRALNSKLPEYDGAYHPNLDHSAANFALSAPAR